MKLLVFLLSLITLLPGCCWSGCIPRCNTCPRCHTTEQKPLDYSYDDTQYNDEINI